MPFVKGQVSYWKGKKRVFSDEWRKNMSIAHLGNKPSKQTIEKMRIRMTGEKNPLWKGGRRKDKDGYIIVALRKHPFSRVGGIILEHRLIMEKHIGRCLLPKEVIHHINGDRTDNRIENLVLFNNQAEHRLLHYVNGDDEQRSEYNERN